MKTISTATIFFMALALHIISYSAVNANLLTNASFEIDANYDGTPDNWYRYGDGTYDLTTADAHTGEKSTNYNGRCLHSMSE